MLKRRCRPLCPVTPLQNRITDDVKSGWKSLIFNILPIYMFFQNLKKRV
jgi:hypothetical protein